MTSNTAAGEAAQHGAVAAGHQRGEPLRLLRERFDGHERVDAAVDAVQRAAGDALRRSRCRVSPQIRPRRSEGCLRIRSVADCLARAPPEDRTSACQRNKTRLHQDCAEICVALASPVRPWTCRSSSPAPPVPCPRRAAGCPRSCCAPGGERILFDCGEGTQHQLLRQRRAAGRGRDLHHPPAPGPLARAAGDDQDLRHARPRPQARGLRPAGPERAVPQVLRPIIGRTGYPLEVVEARAPRGGRLRGLRDRRVPGQPSRRGLRLRVRRGRPPGALRRRGGAQARRHRGPGLRRGSSAARPSTASRPSRSWGRTGRAGGSSTPATRHPSSPSRSTRTTRTS